MRDESEMEDEVVDLGVDVERKTRGEERVRGDGREEEGRLTEEGGRRFLLGILVGG